MHHVQVSGLSIAYRRAGSGPPVVLLHGFTLDSRSWRPQIEGLSDRFTVIAWDAPGAGQSQDPPEGFSLADWARSLAGFLDAAGVERAHIVGLSWGGILAQEFYRLHATRVMSLVLAGTYAGWRGSLPAPLPEERLDACLSDAALAPGDFVEKYLPGMFGDAPPREVRAELAGIMAGFHPSGFRQMATTSALADTRELLPTIRVPTLLVWGDADRRSPIPVAHAFRDAVPGAELQILPGAGHLCNLERPAQFNAVVRDFLIAAASARLESA